jgi:anti-sigma regulatory factor (Ser/Thr protein kinase)
MQHDNRWSHETVVAADTGCAARTRAFVVHHLIEHRLPYLVDEVRLVASELATNAVVHAQTSFTVTLEGREDSVLLTVQDGSRTARAPSRSALHELGMTGLGLVVVNLISETWGVAGDDGTTGSVWACFPLRSSGVSSRIRP